MIMTREDEILMTATCYSKDLKSQVAFKTGVEWADEHPREGLWDKEKVIDWIENNLVKYTSAICSGAVVVRFDNVIKQLCKAMEE